ncbi:AAA family ATPase [Kitasatospora camelliae]|uniref:AAA family ATPase n=1 Tax=Kitasatospora camelliae TaxID=3156397 RepID=A0AAU8K315_9ACTN
MTTTDEPIDTRLEPHDLPSELAMLGRLLLGSGRAILRDVTLTAEDYYRPAHGLIHQAIEAVAETADPIDPFTVTAALQARGHLARIGGYDYLNACIDAALHGGTAEWLDYRIRDLAMRREIVRVGTRIRDLGFTPEDDSEATDLAEHAVTLARELRDAGRAATDSPVLDIHDFLAQADPGYDWVLPGYLEHTDRIVWTAGEGGGKSVLQRQLAVTAAAGLLPFGDGRGNPMHNQLGPQRVLVLDCENSDRQSRRHYRGLIDTAARLDSPVGRGQLHIDIRPQGVDLTRPDGRAWLMRRVEAVMPDLLIVGPIYRLHNGDPNSEELARKVTVVLDDARATAGCALSMEAHSPQGGPMGPRALRPVGSSLWLRWPEFGLGLRPVEDERTATEDRGRRVLPWRGNRDERAWPRFICQGHEGGWPWRAYTPIDTTITGYSPTGALS